MLRTFYSSNLAAVAAIAALMMPQALLAQDQPVVQSINYGDDSSEWANDGECDDSRFSGPGVASTVNSESRERDASDCRKAVDEGRARLKAGVANRPALETIDFGDDASSGARNGECGDPRFRGQGSSETQIEAESGHDASDCRVAYRQERIALKGAVTRDISHIVWGDDAGRWPNDGECDDMRFMGEAMAEGDLDTNQVKHDATDCRDAYEMGTIDLES